MLTLEVLICTIDDGIEKILPNILPPLPQISYLISWQKTSPSFTRCYSELQRPDIKIVTLEGRGLSRNRNNAINHAQGDILVFADDDAIYKQEYFQTILDYFEQYPETHILTFQIETKNGKLLKNYSSSSFLYQDRPKSTYFSSLEIAVKRNFNIPKFNIHFGLGSEYLGCGEEEIFIHEAYLKGAVIRYIPKVIARTDNNTTGQHFMSDVKVRRSKGAVLYYIHGFIGSILRCAKFAYNLPSHKIKFFKDMYDGILYARKRIR